MENGQDTPVADGDVAVGGQVPGVASCGDNSVFCRSWRPRFSSFTAMSPRLGNLQTSEQVYDRSEMKSSTWGRSRVLAVGVVCAAARGMLSPLLTTQAAPEASSTSVEKQLKTAAKSPTRAKNVIFINGDGMSAAQREAGRLSLAGLGGQLQME